MKLCSWTVVLLLAAFGLPAARAAEPIASMSVATAAVEWAPKLADYESLTLTVSGPGGFYQQERFAGGAAPTLGLFDRAGFPLADGVYKYELRVVPQVDAATRLRLRQARESGDESAVRRLQEAGKLPARALVQSGSFSVRNGSFMLQNLQEPSVEAGAGEPHLATRTVLTNSNGVIRSSLCVGFDCPDSPSFSDTTILLMENNTRIKFDDTSVGSFPANDWEIEANSSSSGGLSYLAINDCAGSSQGGCATDPVFLVEAGARTNALYVESDGDVGIGTANPVLELHIVRGDSPGVRLEQDGSSGFAPQTWDVVGNETTFFVRDATNGSTLPFRIEPGTANNMLYLDNGEKVGIGTASPQEKVHIIGTDNPKVLIQDTTDNANDKPGFILRSPAAASGGDWAFETDNAGNFQIDFGPSAGPELVIADQTGTNGAVTINGNLTVNGTFSNPSSRTLKEGFTPVDPQAVLQQLAKLPITEWTYKADPDRRRHVGPIAEDFLQAFGLGSDGKYIFPIDVQGITMAALKGLQVENDALKAENAGIKAENAEIKERLARIEARLGDAAAPQK